MYFQNCFSLKTFAAWQRNPSRWTPQLTVSCVRLSGLAPIIQWWSQSFISICNHRAIQLHWLSLRFFFFIITFLSHFVTTTWRHQSFLDLIVGSVTFSWSWTRADGGGMFNELLIATCLFLDWLWVDRDGDDLKTMVN